MAYREACDQDAACGWDADACDEEECDVGEDGAPASQDLDRGADASGDAGAEDVHEGGGEASLQDAGDQSYGEVVDPSDVPG